MFHPLDHPVYLFLLLALCFSGVYQLGIWDTRVFSAARDQEKRSQVATIQAALLALVGLLLGFTFAMALSRFDLRRQLVIDEANSIGTTGLRASLLPEKYSDEVTHLLQEYVLVRLDFYRSGNDQARLDDAIQRAERLHQRLWSIAVAVAREQPNPITASFIQSLNETIDLASKRLDALKNRIPPVVWWILVFVGAVACFLTGSLHRHTKTLSVLALPMVLAAVLAMIGDLDSPRAGMIRISQESMERLKVEHLYNGPSDAGEREQIRGSGN